MESSQEQIGRPHAKPAEGREPPHPGISPSDDRQAALARVRKFSRFLENSIQVPGTGYRFGLDPLVGLIPGAGDAIGLLLSLYPIWEARRLNVRRWTLGRMTANVILDAVVGAVPLLGDIFDFAFKANTRNIKILERELNRDSPQSP